MKKAGKTAAPETGGRLFGALLAFLAFLLPLKFGSLTVMPDATGFFPDEFFPWLIISWPAHAFGILSALLLFTALLFYRPQPGFWKSPAGILTLLWSFLLPLAVLAGCHGASTRTYALGELANFCGIGSMAAAVALYLARFPEKKFWLLSGFAAGGLALIYSGLYQQFYGFAEMREFLAKQLAEGASVHTGLHAKIQDTRVYATMVSANALSGYLLLLLPVFGVMLYRWGSRFEPQKLSRLLFLIIGIGGLETVFLLTRSRGAFLAAAVCAGLYFPTCRINRFLRYGLLLAIAIVLLGGALFVHCRGRGFTSAVERFDYWRTVAVLCREHPLAGCGWGGFFYRHMQLKTSNTNESARDPHNLILSFAGQAGIPAGLAAAAVLAGTLLLLYGKTLRPDSTPENRAVFWGECAFFLHCMLDIDMHVSANMAAAVMLAALTLSEKIPPPAAPHRQWPAVALPAAVALASLSLNFHWLAGEIALDRLLQLQGEKTPDTAAAFQRYQQARFWRPYAASPMETMGDILLRSGDLNGAETIFKAALKQFPERPSLYRRMRELALLRNDPTAADNALQMMLKLFPTNWEYQELQKKSREQR